MYVLSTVSVVVQADDVVVVNQGTRLLDIVLPTTVRAFIVAFPVERTKLITLSIKVPESSYLRRAQSPPTLLPVSSPSTRAAHLATLSVLQENNFHTLFAALTMIRPIPDEGKTDIFQGTTILFKSSMVTPLFCNSFPVVLSKRAIALSVAEAGHTTSPPEEGKFIRREPSTAGSLAEPSSLTI